MFLSETLSPQSSKHLLLYLYPSCQLTTQNHLPVTFHVLGLPSILNAFEVAPLGRLILSRDYYYRTCHCPYDLACKFVELFFSSTFQFYWCPRTTCKLFYVSALGHTLADQSHFLVEFTRCIFSKASKALAFSTLTFCSVSISSCLGLMYQSDQSNHSESAHLSINYTSVLVQPYFRFLLFP